MAYYQDVTQTIGNTPLVKLARYGAQFAPNATLLAKLELFNPCGSTKDRAALSILEQAERDGLLQPGGVIVEATSGNMGVGLCCVAAARGYRVIITMPDTMSMERRRLLQALGAELILTDGAQGMKGAIAKAEEIVRETGAFAAHQFENKANPDAHYTTTGPEIWRDTEGRIDAFVAGVGTSGTITGVGLYLKEQSPAVRVIAVEPADSPVLSGGKAGPHKLQGIGAGFVPQVLQPSAYDEVVCIRTEEAYEAARACARMEGILVGISSGAALAAAAQVANRIENKGKTIVVLLPDTGERYLSTELFQF